MSRVAVCALNELSLAGVGSSEDDVQLIAYLARTWLALRTAVAEHDRSRVRFSCPPDLWWSTLPGGTSIEDALHALRTQDEPLQMLLKRAITSGTPHEPGEVVVVNGNRATGLAHALSHDGLAVSLDRQGWKRVLIEVSQASGARVNVCNVWSPLLDDVQVAAIDKHVDVLPRYEDPKTHDPESPRYVSGKAHIPRNAYVLFENCVRESQHATAWWARCCHGFFHRFAGALHGSRYVVHWNGTTNENATRVTRASDVPVSVRQRLDSLTATQDCGCRELPGG